MKSLKQKEQSNGYARHAIIRTILNHYKIKLEDLSMEDLEHELYIEEETTKFGEILYQEQGPIETKKEEIRPSDYEIKLRGEELIKHAREEGFIITPKATAVEQRMVSKWKKHENYSKSIVRDTPRPLQESQ
jgi:hypothetical protein